MRLALFAVLAGLAGCPSERSISSLDLGFGSHSNSPAVITHLSFEQPLAPIPPTIASSTADVPGALGGRVSGGSVLTPPSDLDGDGAWTIRLQWADLLTNKAWRATAVVPVNKLTRDVNVVRIGIVIGPNGELLIASDEARPDPSAYHDIAHLCGERVPEADKDWGKDGLFEDYAQLLAAAPPPPVRDPFCPFPEE